MQHPESKADVLPEIANQGKAPLIPVELLCRVDAAELQHSSSARFLRRHPSPQGVFGHHLKMRFDLTRQIGLVTGACDRANQSFPPATQRFHYDSLRRAKNRATTPVACCH